MRRALLFSTFKSQRVQHKLFDNVSAVKAETNGTGEKKMAYLVISITTIVFLFFVVKGIKSWHNQIKYPIEETYGLIVEKYSKEIEGIHSYSIVFQVRDCNTVYQVPHEVYIHIDVPVRGALRHQGEKFVSFEK